MDKVVPSVILFGLIAVGMWWYDNNQPSKVAEAECQQDAADQGKGAGCEGSGQPAYPQPAE